MKKTALLSLGLGILSLTASFAYSDDLPEGAVPFVRGQIVKSKIASETQSAPIITEGSTDGMPEGAIPFEGGAIEKPQPVKQTPTRVETNQRFFLRGDRSDMEVKITGEAAETIFNFMKSSLSSNDQEKISTSQTIAKKGIVCWRNVAKMDLGERVTHACVMVVDKDGIQPIEQ